MAYAGNFNSAALMELEVALGAVEAIEQQPPAALAEGQREERLPGELVGHVRHHWQLVQDANCHLQS